MNNDRDWHTFILDKDKSFEERCKELFRWHSENNPVYNRFINAFGIKPESDISINEIPLLPIKAFKETEVLVDGVRPEVTFTSSGTSEMQKSRHLLPDASLYKKVIETEFYRHFPKEEYSLLCYTPGYSDNPESSLIWMLKTLIDNDSSRLSSFLPLDEPLTISDTQRINKYDKKLVLFGAAFGLMDLIELGSDPLPDGSHIIETGGMKTHRRKMSKTDLRNSLSESFQIEKNHIHSEYGMCELTSQMYAIGSERFHTPNWVGVSVRNPDNPFELCEPGKEGKIGIIDLANIYTCPFILTDDRGVLEKDGTFRILGRWNDENLRGCNFLIDNES